MSQDTTRWVLYGRSSSANHKSITDQLAEIRAAATAEGGTVVEELSDPTSASRYATRVRANWSRLLALAPTIDTIGLWEPSRGDRTLASWVAFIDVCRDHNTRVYAHVDERLYNPRRSGDYRDLATAGVSAAHESNQISDRTRKGKRGAYAAGHPSGKLDFGYARRYDTSTVPPRYREQVPHPEQAPVVVRIVEQVAAGHTLYAVAKALNDDRVPTMRGAPYWRPGVVRGIATNPIYRPHPDQPQRGCLRRNGTVYVGTWPPLVTESLWQQVQRVLGTDDPAKRTARRNSAPGRVKYLLSGSRELLTAPCGYDVTGFAARPGRAAHYLCKLDGCAAVPMAEADEYVSRLVCARLAKRDARALWVADDTAAQAAEEELARLSGELEEARRSFATPGGITAAAMAMKEQAMAGPIADAERRSRPAGVPLALLELIDAGQIEAERVRPAWDAMPVVARREVIAWLFARLRLGPVVQRITRWTLPEERLAIVADRVSIEWKGAT